MMPLLMGGILRRATQNPVIGVIYVGVRKILPFKKGVGCAKFFPLKGGSFV